MCEAQSVKLARVARSNHPPVSLFISLNKFFKYIFLTNVKILKHFESDFGIHFITVNIARCPIPRSLQSLLSTVLELSPFNLPNLYILFAESDILFDVWIGHYIHDIH